MRFLSLLINERTLSTLLLAMGIAFAGYNIGNSILKFRLLDRQVSVKGLAQREVVSDLGTWTITSKVATNNLDEGYNKIESDKVAIVDFLQKAGFDPSEITYGNYTVTDLLAQTYRQNNSEQFRYIISSPIIVQTAKVELLQKTAQGQSNLTQKEVVFENDGPFYEFTKFNDLKPEMLAEGIKNARIAAEKFASDSGSSVGQLKKANQGTFIIGAVGSVESENSYDNAQNARKSLRKKIRIVTTLEYFLE